MDAESVTNRFLRAFLTDRERGAVRTLQDYQADFPGHEDLIAREYAGMSAGQGEGELGQVGPYRLLSELGRGGQGVVYLAEDRRLGRRVALKVLTGFGALDERARVRLLREAELASRLDHPSICTVYESGEHEGVPYVAMRLVDGGTLADELARRVAASALPDGEAVRDAARVMEHTARAVHAAHAAGVVHRDLKPGNIALQRDGLPVVLDFGLARDEDGLTLTRTGDLFGTPTYMAPEQVAGNARYDPRTDVYALGVILYECLALEPPFSAPTRAGLFHAIRSAPPPDPRRRNRSVPTDLKVIVDTALQKERSQRYRTALDLAEDLHRFLAREPIHARPLSTVKRVLLWGRREPLRAALIVLLVVGLPAAGAVGGYVYARSVAEVLATGEITLEQQARDRALAQAYLVLLGGAPAESYPQFEQILARSAADAEALTGAVLSLFRTGRDPEASAVLDRAQDDGADPRVVSQLRSLLADKGAATAAAAAAPADAALLFVTAATAMTAAPIWREAEAATAALDGLTRAAFLAPRPRPHVALSMALAAYRAGDGAAANRAADTLQQLWPGSPVAHWGAAVALAPFEPVRAIDVQEALLQDEALPAPLRAQVLQSRGFALGELERRPEAVAALEQAVALDETPARLLALGIERRAAGDPEGSVAALQRAVELEPNYDRAHYNLGIGYRMLDRDDLAEEAYRVTTRLRPDHSFAHNNLGNLLRDSGRAAEAERHYLLALQHQPTNVDVLGSLGRHLFREGRTVEALSVLFRAISFSPHPATALWNLAREVDERDIEVPREELLDALYRAAVDTEPDHARAWNDYGFFRVQRGDMAGAYAAFAKAAFADPDEAQYRGNLVLALGKLDRWAEVRPVLEQLRERNPGVAGVALKLADFLVSAETPVEFQDAMAARDIATELLGQAESGDQPIALLVLGRAQRLLGDRDAADRTLTRALQLVDALQPPPPQIQGLRAALRRELATVRGNK